MPTVFCSRAQHLTLARLQVGSKPETALSGALLFLPDLDLTADGVRVIPSEAADPVKKRTNAVQNELGH